MLTLDAIREHNSRAGEYFFSPATMRFFSSRLLRGVIETPSGGWFVTSERYTSLRGNGPRRYTVRFYRRDNGTIEEGSDFQAFSTAASARRWMVRAAKRPEPVSEWAACADAGHPGIEHGIRCSNCCRCLHCGEQRQLAQR